MKFTICVLSFSLFLLSGCVIPWFSTSTKSPAIYGRVVDAATKAPIQGATVAFVEKPSIGCQTSADGSFAIDATHNVHLLMLVGPCGSEWPEGHYYKEWTISKPGYESRTMNIYGNEFRADNKAGDKLYLKDIELNPTTPR